MAISIPMKSNLLPLDVSVKPINYCFVEDKDFSRNAKRSLKPFLRDGSEIRSFVSERERVFVYIHIPKETHGSQCLVELSDKGEFLGELQSFSEMQDFRYGDIAVNKKKIFIEDYRGPPNRFVLGSDLKPEHEGEMFEYERRLFVFSRESKELEKICALRYSVNGLTADDEDRLFGVSVGGSIGGMKTRIVELIHNYGENKTLEAKIDEQPTTSLARRQLPLFFLAEKTLFESKYYVSELTRAIDGRIFYYNSVNKILYGLNTNIVAKFISQEQTHWLRSVDAFIILDDFCVYRVHEYKGNNPPYKERIILKGFAYGNQTGHFSLNSGFSRHSFLAQPQPLAGNAFVIKQDGQLRKYLIEPINHLPWHMRLKHRIGRPQNDNLPNRNEKGLLTG